jgi:uncharacterized protein (UPF0276 family)
VSSTAEANSSGPILAGAGIGLRSAHHEALLRERPRVGWIEVHTENYFHDGGPHALELERAREAYPLSLHGVGMGLGSVDPLDRMHVARVKRAIERFAPSLVSEHACWTSHGGEHFNDLLPLPYTEEAALHLAGRITQVQDMLGRQILIENLSCYLSFHSSRLTEWEFLTAVVERSGCGLLLDVNNAYVNSVNVGLDATALINGLPAGAVQEIHLAGHARRVVDGREILLDDHGSQVPESVWTLYELALRRHGPVPTLIEWDTNLPELSVLVAEADRAQARLEAAHALAA